MKYFFLFSVNISQLQKIKSMKNWLVQASTKHSHRSPEYSHNQMDKNPYPGWCQWKIGMSWNDVYITLKFCLHINKYFVDWWEKFQFAVNAYYNFVQYPVINLVDYEFQFVGIKAELKNLKHTFVKHNFCIDSSS